MASQDMTLAGLYFKHAFAIFESNELSYNLKVAIVDLNKNSAVSSINLVLYLPTRYSLFQMGLLLIQ